MHGCGSSTGREPTGVHILQKEWLSLSQKLSATNSSSVRGEPGRSPTPFVWDFVWLDKGRPCVLWVHVCNSYVMSKRHFSLSCIHILFCNVLWVFRGGGEVLHVLGNHSAAESHPSSLISSILLLPALSAAADTAESYILMKAWQQGS